MESAICTKKCLADEAWEKGRTVRTGFEDFRENTDGKRRKFYIEETVTPIRNINGEYNLAITIGRDVTRQKILTEFNKKLQGVKYNKNLSLKSQYEKKIIDILLQGITEFGIDRARFYFVSKERGFVERVANTEKSPGKAKSTIALDDDLEGFIDQDKSFYRLYGKDKLEKEKKIDWGDAPNSCTLKVQVEKELIGLIGMDNHKSGRAIKPKGFDYLRNLLHYAGLTIKSMRETHNYESIKKISGEINRNLSAKDLSQTIVRNICRYFNTEMSTIFVYNKATDSLGKGATCIRKVDDTGKVIFRTDIGNFLETYRRGDFITGRIFIDMATECLNDVPGINGKHREIIEKYEKEILDSGRIQNAIFSTLVINNRPVGLLRCANKLDYEGKILESGFREDEKDSFQFIGNLIADVLANQKFLEKLNIIAEMARYIQGEEAAELDRTLFLMLTCITLGQGLGFNRAVLFLKDENDDDMLVVKRAVGPFDEISVRRIYEDKIWLDLNNETISEILNRFKAAFMEEGDFSFFHTPGLNKKEFYLSERFNAAVREISHSIRKEKNIITQTFSNRKGTIPVGQDNFLKKIGIKREHSGHYHSVPLIFSGRNIGVIYVDNIYNSRPTDPSDIELLRIFSNHISIAIENAREYQLSKKINEIIAEITKNENLDAIFGTIQHEIKKLYKVNDVCVMLESRKESSALRKCELIEKETGENEQEANEYCIRCNDEILEKIKSGESKQKNLINRDQILDFHPGYRGTAKSRIISPIIFENQVIGVLDIYSYQEDQFTEFEEQLFVNLSSQIAILVNRIKRTEKEKEQYIIDLTHDVKTKIQKAMTVSGNMELGFIEPGDIVEKSIEITNTLQLLDNEITELRSSVTADDDKFFSFKKAAILPCIERSLRLVQETPININRGEIKNLPKINLNKRLMTHLFTNLLINAVKYSTDLEKFPIEVNARTCDIQIIFEVINYGIKIHDPGKIFDKWYREEEAKGIYITGSGLGLDFCKRIVAKHKGVIRAESAEFKEGIFRNVFTIIFFIKSEGEKNGTRNGQEDFNHR